MEKGNYLVLFSVLALLVGMSFGFVMNSAMIDPVVEEKLVPNPVNQDLQDQVLSLTKQLAEAQSSGQGEVETVEVEVPVADASLFLDGAKKAVFDELGDEDDFLTCNGHEYDEDEVSIQRVKEWSYTWLDDDEYEVWFKAKFEFQDDSDERDCKETREYTVVFEEGEDPVVE